MPTLSVIMIVKNEEAVLAQCLKSVRAVADEIVVADTGSNDGTVAVAEQYGAKVLHIPWRDDFAAARNAGMAAATGDWLLHLDADEVVDAAGAQRIRQIVDADGDGADAIELTLLNYCNSPRAWRWTPAAPDDPAARGATGYIPVPLLRLFRNRRGYEYREPVHENITESVVEKGGIIRAEDIRIHHYGYGGDDARAAEKAQFYLALARRKAAQRPDDPKSWSDLAEQLVACDRPEEAADACRQALQLAPGNVNASMTLANILLNRGELDEARATLEALEQTGHAPLAAVTALAAIAEREGRLDQALALLKKVLTAEPGSAIAALYLSRVLDRLHQPDAAEEVLTELVARAPALAEPRARLEALRLRRAGEGLVIDNMPNDALGRLVAALKLDPEDPLTHNAIGVVLAALGKPDDARRSFHRSLRLAPGMKEAEENLREMTGR